jgi:K+/H+ antiporter YhaU regulatory subunit KhtT
MRVNILHELDDELKLVEDLDKENQPAVMDYEGELLFHVHPQLMELDQADRTDVIMHFVGVYDRMYSQQFRAGEMYGREETAKRLQQILGMDRLIKAVERVADSR